MKQEHGIEGHLNAYILDHNDSCTGFGKHDRVVAFVPQGGKMYCRVDFNHGLGTPTTAEILKAAKKRNGTDQRGKWILESTYEGETCADYNFIQERT